LKIVEKENLIKDLSLNTFITNFKTFYWRISTELKGGICEVFQYECHSCKQSETNFKDFVEKKEDILLFSHF